MKISFLSAVLMAVVILASCAKEMDSPVSSDSNSFDQAKIAGNNLRIMWCLPASLSAPEGPMWLCRCYSSNGNCLPTVDIVGAANEVLNDFEEDLGNGHLSQFFSRNEDYKIIFPELERHPNMLTGIRNGELTFSEFYSEDKNVKFFALHGSNDQVDGSNVSDNALLVFDLRIN